MEDQRKSELLYAKMYSQLPIVGTRYLAFRDVPDLIKKYVRGTKTLDYGCGPGHSTIFLNSLGLDANGVDINQHMIDSATELDPYGTYSLIKSGVILANDETYNLVFTSFVLPYVSTKCEMISIMKETYRVLQSGGTFIVVVPSEDFYKYRWLVENTQFEGNRSVSGALQKAMFLDLTLFHYYWNDQDYREAFEKSGLKVLYKHDLFGKDTDGIQWVNEKVASPTTIYVAQKMGIMTYELHNTEKYSLRKSNLLF